MKVAPPPVTTLVEDPPTEVAKNVTIMVGRGVSFLNPPVFTAGCGAMRLSVNAVADEAADGESVGGESGWSLP